LLGAVSLLLETTSSIFILKWLDCFAAHALDGVSVQCTLVFGKKQACGFVKVWACNDTGVSTNTDLKTASPVRSSICWLPAQFRLHDGTAEERRWRNSSKPHCAGVRSCSHCLSALRPALLCAPHVGFGRRLATWWAPQLTEARASSLAKEEVSTFSELNWCSGGLGNHTSWCRKGWGGTSPLKERREEPPLLGRSAQLPFDISP